MQVELTDQELHNVRVALRITMKQPDVDEAAMKELLALSDRFVPDFTPNPPKADVQSPVVAEVIDDQSKP